MMIRSKQSATRLAALLLGCGLFLWSPVVLADHHSPPASAPADASAEAESHVCEGHDCKGHDCKGHDCKGHDCKGHDCKGHYDSSKSRHGKRHKDPAARVRKHAEELGLTPEQLSEIDRLVETQREASDGVRQLEHDARAELRNRIEVENPDPGAIIREIESLGKMRTQREIQRTLLEIEIQRVLSPEQREQLWSLKKAKREGRGCAKCGRKDGECSHHGGKHEGCGGECPHAAQHGADSSSAGHHAHARAEGAGPAECPHAKAAAEAARAQDL